MGKILYLECNSGISGDMTIGALLDLGANRKVLEEALASLPVKGYHLHFGRTKKCGLDAYDFDVHLEEETHEHSHSHKTHKKEEIGHEHEQDDLYKTEEEHSHEQDNLYKAEEEHSHEQDHLHRTEAINHHHEHEHLHKHIHRNLSDIYEIIEGLHSNESVKVMAKHMFQIVAEAESKAHGVPVEEVHFHEVGAVDSIIDIVGVAVCLGDLKVDEVVVSPLTEGRGCVRCQHGVIPVPVPATANIAAAYGLELRLTDNEGEMVTPTGAAIAAAIGTRKKLPSSCKLIKIGMGAGKKEFPQANVLRAMLLEEEKENPEKVWMLETNIDDCGGEALGFVTELLLESGALDVWSTPIFMKKGRPAYLISVLCKKEEIEQMEKLLFLHTTTIGIRKYSVFRTILERALHTVETVYGPAQVKICAHKGKKFYYPEYESVRAICQKEGIDFQSAYIKIQETAKELF